MKTITTGSSIMTILSQTGRLIGTYWHLLLLGALSIRLIGAANMRALEHLFHIQQLGAKLTSTIQTSMPEITIQPNGSLDIAIDQIDPSMVSELYNNVWTLISPYLPGFIGLWLLSTIGSVIVYMIVSYTIFDDFDEQPHTRTQKIHQAVTQLIPYLLTVFLQSLILLIGFGLFLIPGIILLIYFAFTQQVILYEKIYGLAALRRSRELVSQRRRVTLGNLILIGLILIIGSVLLTSFVGYLASHISHTFIQTALISLSSNIVGIIGFVMIVVFFVRWRQSKHADTNNDVPA